MTSELINKTFIKSGSTITKNGVSIEAYKSAILKTNNEDDDYYLIMRGEQNRSHCIMLYKKYEDRGRIYNDDKSFEKAILRIEKKYKK